MALVEVFSFSLVTGSFWMCTHMEPCLQTTAHIFVTCIPNLHTQVISSPLTMQVILLPLNYSLIFPYGTVTYPLVPQIERNDW